MAGKPKVQDLLQRIHELENELFESKQREGRLAEDSLCKKEERFRKILESIEDGYYEMDLAGNLTFFNKALCRIHGYPPHELMGMSYRTYTSRESAKRIFSFFNQIYQTGISARIFDHEVIRKDGSTIVLQVSASVLRDEKGAPVGFYGISRDVTEKKRAEEALRKSEEKYRSILENMEEGYYEVDLTGNYTFFNESVCRFHGGTKDELMGLNYRQYLSNEDADRVFTIFSEIYRKGTSVAPLDYRMIAGDGSTRNIELSASLLRDAWGKPVGFRGVSRDITERKRTEKALRESEEKYRLLVENANEGIFILQDGKVKFPNNRVKVLTGYTAEEMAQRPFSDLVHFEDRDSFGDSNPSSFRVKTRENEILWVELNTVPVTWEGSEATLNFLRDITPQKRMEVQLLQAKKMEALGTLAGGIAHDFNNLLMGIQGNTSLMGMDMDPAHPCYENLHSIEQMVRAGAGLTKQLLGAARGGKYEVQPTDMNQLVATSADLFGRTRKEITLHKSLQGDLQTVEVDRGQIEQVILNLYVNAWHAMPGGGDLYLQTANVTLAEEDVAPYGIRSGKFVRVSVTDSGTGMDEATRQRVFDPFFTTKGMGRGTGLGLSSSYGIVRNHGGVINVYSEKGRGSTFNIYLPVSNMTLKKQKEPPEAVLRGSETILFVDDEETVAHVGSRLLARLGYRVITAASGEEALEIYRARGRRIDLVVLDMIMPRMNGGETFDRLMEIDPNVRVLLCSGYSLKGQAKTILNRGCKGFIQKPFSLGELSKRVRQVLDE